MDLQWINSFILPLLLLLGTVAALLMIIILLVDTISFYKHKQSKRTKTKEPSQPVAQSDGITPKAGPVENPPYMGSGVTTGSGTTPGVSKNVERRSKIKLGLRMPKMNLMRQRAKKKSSSEEQLTPPSAPELPKTVEEGSIDDRSSTPMVPSNNASPDLPRAEGITSVEDSTKSVSMGQKEQAETKEPEPATAPSSAEGGKKSKLAEVNDGPEEAQDEYNGSSKIKVKPLASLEEARSIIEAKTKAAESNNPIQPQKETDDVAALLGIPITASNPPSPGENSASVRSSGDSNTNPSSEKKGIPEQPPETLSKTESKQSGGSSEKGSDKKAVIEYPGPVEQTAADLLQLNSAEDEAVVLSRQLSELKNSLVELQSKLKSLKNK